MAQIRDPEGLRDHIMARIAALETAAAEGMQDDADRISSEVFDLVSFALGLEKDPRVTSAPPQDAA